MGILLHTSRFQSKPNLYKKTKTRVVDAIDDMFREMVVKASSLFKSRTTPGYSMPETFLEK